MRMEIQDARTTPSDSNQQRNVNTVRWESMNITIQTGEVDAFVVNSGMNITTNNFYI